MPILRSAPLYDREAATWYAAKWYNSRNPKFGDFSDMGGDCTNFISQCLYAGGSLMNYTPTYGWYYASMTNRSPSWSGVQFLYNFLTTNQKRGPYGIATSFDKLLPGDIVQLGTLTGHFYHSLLVMQASQTGYEDLLITTHTYDVHLRPLADYEFGQARFIHIQGIRL